MDWGYSKTWTEGVVERLNYWLCAWRFFLTTDLLCFRYYVLLIIGSIFLVAVVFLKFTSRGRRSLQLARRAIFPYAVHDEQHVRVRTSEFVDAEGKPYYHYHYHYHRHRHRTITFTFTDTITFTFTFTVTLSMAHTVTVTLSLSLSLTVTITVT